MASIYKRSKNKNEPYTIQYVDHSGKRRTEKGFTDKGLTEQLAAKLEGEARLRATGLIDPEQERFAEHRLAPIDGHLAAFEESLLDNSPLHVSVTIGRVKKIVEGCEFKRLADFDTEAVRRFLRKLRRAEDFGNRTINHYMQAIDSFCIWCVASKRLIANPLCGMERLNTEVDIRRKRRALAATEVGRLINAARVSKVRVERLSGPQRARIYVLSYLTGLRRKELGSLTPRSFKLDASPPTVTVEAACSKHRRKDVLPLHSALVAMLPGWLKEFAPGQKLFPGLEKRRTARMVRRDLKDAGIPFETDEGIADFHAAGRHTHITELLRNGATLPEAKELARHSDIKMTMKYTHIGLGDQAKAVANLPAPPPEPRALPAPATDTALHGRCKSGGFESPRLSSSDNEPGSDIDAKSRGSSKLDAGCRCGAMNGKVGPLGLEPRTNRL
jgi:site-specific recombinase XerD